MVDINYFDTALEAIARNTIKKFDETLLTGEPRAIPIEEIIEQHFGLNIEYHFLRKDGRILGETVFNDGAVPIYDMETKKYTLIMVGGGTIIIDASLLRMHSLGRLRFTFAHELAHWILHYEFYVNSGEIAALEKSNISALVKNKIEQQANILGTAFLMPIGQVKKAFYGLRNSNSSDIAIVKMSELFNVSKQSMEIRLKTHNLI